MSRSILAALACAAMLAASAPIGAVTLQGMQDFKSLHGRYGPKGDCKKYPQVVIDASGFALDHGQGKLERASGTPEYAASFFGRDYEGDALAFFPYWTEGGANPFLVLIGDERPGSLRIEPHDFGWKGGPAMPERYRPWLQGSPYAKCGD